jgi:hypothetical protein
VYLLTLSRVHIVVVLTVSGSLAAFFAAAISFSNRVLGVAHRRITTYGEGQACHRCGRHASGAGEHRVEHAAWNFNIRMWQRGQEQPCRPDALGGGVLDGFVNDTGEFVLGQATVAARNEEFYLSKVHCGCEKYTAQTAVAGGEVFFARWMGLRRYVR